MAYEAMLHYVRKDRTQRDMGGDWGDALKIYIGDNAKDLLEWIYGTRIVVKRKLQTEFKVRTIEADALLEAEAKKADLLFATKLFADLVFKDKEDQQWLERIFAMYRDPLVQTPTYQKILKEGRMEGLRQSVLKIVENRFPSLTELAQERVQRMNKSETFDYAFDALLTVPDENAARTLLESLAD